MQAFQFFNVIVLALYCESGCSMLLQLLRLWALAAAVTGASITTSSRHTRATPSCQELPTNYDYQNSQGHNLQSSQQNCRVSRGATVEYMNCNTPALLTDGEHGPQLYNSTEQDQYYHIVRGETEILFTFSDVEIVREIEIYYYSDVNGNKSLPRVSVYLVNNGFTIGNELTQSRIATVGPIEPNREQIGLRRQVIGVNISSKKWVLRVDMIQHQFYLSEVSFFSCPQNPLETTGIESTTTTSAGNDPTATVAKIGTTPSEPASHTTTTTANITTAMADTTTVDTTQPHTKPIAEAKGSTSMVSMLPWLLMGIATMLFVLLLTANITCCLVYMVKRYKTKRYELKRNPSYLPSPRVIGTENRVFDDDHIYDVPAT